MRTSPYRPHTVLVGGITSLGKARLSDALPADPFKPTQPDQTMPNPTKPTKPAKVKTSPQDEDYSTPYVPPPVALGEVPIVKDGLIVDAMATQVPELDDIVIEDGIPLPAGNVTNLALSQALLARLQPGQSAKLRLDIRGSLQKVISAAHKANQGKFVTRPGHDDDKTLRVWRVA